MVQPPIIVEYRCKGIPQKRPYELSWELAIGNIREENHKRTFYFHRTREGPDDTGNFVTTRISCLTEWRSSKGRRRAIRIAGIDRLNSKRLDSIHFSLIEGYGKDFKNYQADFYGGPRHAEYLLYHRKAFKESPILPLPLPLSELGISLRVSKKAFPPPQEVGRLFMNCEDSFFKATQANPPKIVRKVIADVFVPFNSTQYSEKEEPLRRLFIRADRLYSFLRYEFKKRAFLAKKPRAIDDILWPQFKKLIDFSLENLLIQFPEPQTTALPLMLPLI